VGSRRRKSSQGGTDRGTGCCTNGDVFVAGTKMANGEEGTAGARDSATLNRNHFGSNWCSSD
jgi:hypothetical protein